MTRVLLTLREYATWADPPIAARTLRDLVVTAQLPHRDTVVGRGRPAKRYDSADLDRLHADWVRGNVSCRRDTRVSADLAQSS